MQNVRMEMQDARAGRLDDPDGTIEALHRFIHRHRRIAVLTGAGVSTESGIPDYRDLEGGWKRPPPMTYQVFTESEAGRRRYWARSMAGWPLMASARPNEVHVALAALEARGRTSVLITQNVDGLHQQAGSREIVELHGRLDRVACLACGTRSERAALQRRLEVANPGWAGLVATVAPDGDADLEAMDFESFHIPACEVCGGVLKPDVVFFGEAVPRARVQSALASVAASDALLVVGSSLMVFSSFRFARQARELGLPVAAVNLGRTRADDFLQLKVALPAAEALAFLLPSSASSPAATARPAHPDPAGSIPAA